MKPLCISWSATYQWHSHEEPCRHGYACADQDGERRGAIAARSDRDWKILRGALIFYARFTGPSTRGSPAAHSRRNKICVEGQIRFIKFEANTLTESWGRFLLNRPQCPTASDTMMNVAHRSAAYLATARFPLSSKKRKMDCPRIRQRCTAYLTLKRTRKSPLLRQMIANGNAGDARSRKPS